MKRFVFGAMMALVLAMLPGAAAAVTPCDLDNPCTGCGEACIDGACQFLACDGKQCGPDGCGGFCGECAVGQFCDLDQCSATLPRGCEANDAAGCSVREYQCLAVTANCTPACSAGDKCVDGVCLTDEVGCGLNGAPACDGVTEVCQKIVTGPCGCESCVASQYPECLDKWDLVCVMQCEQCGTSCTACEPNCNGKECGSDGCGGSCGTCGDGEICTEGQCVVDACAPSCDGRECGVDGCGNSCGECADGYACVDSECVADPCHGISYEGCCSGNVMKWCNGSEIVSEDCSEDLYCGWDGAGYYCGTDGSADPDNLFPMVCPDCTPACNGKQCGPDGCGGYCGVCPGDQSCVEGACVACVPSCEWAECGDDGCGGSCGACAEGQTCYEGMCLGDNCGGITDIGCCDGATLKFCSMGELTEMSCADTPSCGWNNGAQYYDCGSEPVADPSGVNPMVCPGACQIDCTGKVCGDDGCGGSCGACDAGETCEAGQCVCAPQCEGKACGDDGCGGTCGDCDAGEHCAEGACVPDVCEPTCGDKECGDDGCGGSCGTCDADEECKDGYCESTCAPACTGKECGDNGCGGTCGTCAANETCEAGQCVGTEPDVVEPAPDTAEPTDTATGDTATPDQEEEGGGGGGCSVDGGSSFGSFWLLALALGLIPVWRRREA
jgi:MYXO-CTERM domain-containing protein